MCLNRLMFMVVGKYTVNIWILWDVEKKLMSLRSKMQHMRLLSFSVHLFPPCLCKGNMLSDVTVYMCLKKTFQRQVFREKSAKHID